MDINGKKWIVRKHRRLTFDLDKNSIDTIYSYVKGLGVYAWLLWNGHDLSHLILSPFFDGINLSETTDYSYTELSVTRNSSNVLTIYLKVKSIDDGCK